MFSSRKKAVMPDPAAALPGRTKPIDVPERHCVKPPFPTGMRARMRAEKGG